MNGEELCRICGGNHITGECTENAENTELKLSHNITNLLERMSDLKENPPPAHGTKKEANKGHAVQETQGRKVIFLLKLHEIDPSLVSIDEIEYVLVEPLDVTNLTETTAITKLIQAHLNFKIKKGEYEDAYNLLLKFVDNFPEEKGLTLAIYYCCLNIKNTPKEIRERFKQLTLARGADIKRIEETEDKILATGEKTLEERIESISSTFAADIESAKKHGANQIADDLTSFAKKYLPNFEVNLREREKEKQKPGIRTTITDTMRMFDEGRRADAFDTLAELLTRYPNNTRVLRVQLDLAFKDRNEQVALEAFSALKKTSDDQDYIERMRRVLNNIFKETKPTRDIQERHNEAMQRLISSTYQIIQDLCEDPYARRIQIRAVLRSLRSHSQNPEVTVLTCILNVKLLDQVIQEKKSGWRGKGRALLSIIDRKVEKFNTEGPEKIDKLRLEILRRRIEPFLKEKDTYSLILDTSNPHSPGKETPHPRPTTIEKRRGEKFQIEKQKLDKFLRDGQMVEARKLIGSLLRERHDEPELLDIAFGFAVKDSQPDAAYILLNQLRPHITGQEFNKKLYQVRAIERGAVSPQSSSVLREIGSRKPIDSVADTVTRGYREPPMDTGRDHSVQKRSGRPRMRPVTEIKKAEVVKSDKTRKIEKEETGVERATSRLREFFAKEKKDNKYSSGWYRLQLAFIKLGQYIENTEFGNRLNIVKYVDDIYMHPESTENYEGLFEILIEEAVLNPINKDPKGILDSVYYVNEALYYKIKENLAQEIRDIPHYPADQQKTAQIVAEYFSAPIEEILSGQGTKRQNSKILYYRQILSYLIYELTAWSPYKTRSELKQDIWKDKKDQVNRDKRKIEELLAVGDKETTEHITKLKRLIYAYA